MASLFPASLDTFRAPVQDFVALTLTNSPGTGGTDFVFAETALVDSISYFDIALVIYDDTLGLEIVIATANPSSGHLTVTRAQEGTSAIDLTAGMIVTFEASSYYVNILRDSLLTAQKYLGVLTTSDPVDSAEDGEVRVRTDNETVWFRVNSTWKLLDTLDHSALSGRDVVADHDQYQDNTRATEWHSNDPGYTNTPGGAHITNPTTHTHDGTEGAPIVKLRSGDTLPSVNNRGDVFVYINGSTKNVYFSLDGSTWTQYISMPTGSLLFFESSCPAGWTDQSSTMDGKYLKGSASGQYNEGTGGSLTHTHGMPDLINHSHDIGARSGSTNSNSHSHSIGGGPDSGTTRVRRASGSGSGHTSNNNHSHAVSYPAFQTDDAGLVSPLTDEGSSEPKHVTLILCRKD